MKKIAGVISGNVRIELAGPKTEVPAKIVNYYKEA